MKYIQHDAGGNRLSFKTSGEMKGMVYSMEMMKRENTVEVSNVTKHLGSFCLEEMTMELPKGYIMGLIGPNGSGKTTLIHLLLGLYKPANGTVVIEGKTYDASEKSIREEVGTVLQERLFEEYRTLQENADYCGKYYKNYDAKLLAEYLERFELDANRKYKGLSKGEELKFQFAFALSHKPKLLILDEPTGNFDPEFREEFFSALKAFIADGEHSVILATHLTEDLDRIADYITYLENGKMLFSLDIEEMKERYRIISGDAYKLKLLPPESVIHMEQGEYGSKALVRHRRRFSYGSLQVNYPTIEELMYYITKRKGEWNYD